MFKGKVKNVRFCSSQEEEEILNNFSHYLKKVCLKINRIYMLKE